MKFYFERKTEGLISKEKIYSYESFLAGLTSAFFNLRFDENASVGITAAFLTILFMGMCAIVTLVDIKKEIKSLSSCNLYDVSRLVICLVILIIACTWIISIHG